MKKFLFILYLLIYCSFASAQVVDSTQALIIKKILIVGNQKTKSKIITRELSFEEGRTYKKFELDSMFEWDRNRIYNSNLFNEVNLTLDQTEGGSTNVLITVDERWYFYPIPIFKLIDRNFNDWWVNRNRDFSRVNYGLKLTKYNFRGRAERLRVSGQFGFTRRLNFSYRIPYIEKSQRHGLDLDFNYLETKNLAVDTERNVRTFLESEDLLRKVYRNKITHSYRNSFYSYHFLSLGHTSVTIADTVQRINPNYLGTGGLKQRYFTFGYSYLWDKRNNRNYTTDGAWHSVGIRKFGIGLHNDVSFWAIDFRLSKYKDLGKDMFYAGNIIGLLSFPEERGYFNYFAIGFQRNVMRGFDLTIVEGSSFFIQKNEIKKKFFSNTYDISNFMPLRQFATFPVTLYGKIFLDQGYAKSYPNHVGSDLLDDQYLYSYGLGLDLMIIYDAVFRFEFSRNTLGQNNFFINFGAAL